MAVTEMRYKSGRVLRIIDGEYVIGAGGSCKNEIKCPKKVFNGYVVRKCSDDIKCSDDDIKCDNVYIIDNNPNGNVYYEKNGCIGYYYRSPADYGITNDNFYFSIKANGEGVIGFGSVHGGSGDFLRINGNRLCIANVNGCKFTHSETLKSGEFNKIEWCSNRLIVNGVINKVSGYKIFNHSSSPLSTYGVWDDWKGGGDDKWGCFDGVLRNFKIGRKA